MAVYCCPLEKVTILMWSVLPIDFASLRGKQLEMEGSLLATRQLALHEIWIERFLAQQYFLSWMNWGMAL